MEGGEEEIHKNMSGLSDSHEPRYLCRAVDADGPSQALAGTWYLWVPPFRCLCPRPASYRQVPLRHLGPRPAAYSMT